MPSRSPSGSGSATGILDPPFSRIVVNNSSGRTDPLGALEGLAWLAQSFQVRKTRTQILTRLGESGADAFTIQKIAGHSSAVISQRYAHPMLALAENAFSRASKHTTQQRRPQSSERSGCSESLQFSLQLPFGSPAASWGNLCRCLRRMARPRRFELEAFCGRERKRARKAAQARWNKQRGKCSRDTETVRLPKLFR